MENPELVQILVSVARVNFDLIRAYGQALEKIDPGDKDVREHFTAFRNEHLRQARDLEEAIESLGEKPPEMRAAGSKMTVDVLDSPDEAQGTTDVLKVMRKNEYFSNKTYSEAIADEFYTTYPLNVQVLFQRHYREEQKHQKYIDAELGVLAGR